MLWIWTCGGDGPTEPKIELPTVQNIEFTLEENTSITFAFLGSDPLNRALTYSVSTQPQHGTLTINAGSGTYTPNTNYYGVDTFGYIATNVDGTSNIGTVIATVTPVNEEPFITFGPDIRPTNVIQVSDGGYVFGGTNENDSSNYYIFLAKIDNNGTIVWSKVLDENYENGKWRLHDMVRLEDDSLILLGTHNHDGSKIINIDADGNVLKTITSTTDFYKIRPWGSRYNGDEFLLSGVSNLYILSHNDNFQNVKSFNNNIQAIDATTDSLMIVSTQTNTGSHFYKLSPNSTEIWNMGINLNVGTLKIPSVLALPDGDVVVAGHETHNSNTLFYGRIGSDGNLKQSTTVSNGETTAEFLEQAHDGGFISTGQGGPGLNVLKTGAGLNQEWYKTYKLEGLYVEGTSILKTIDGGYIISGYEQVEVDNEWKHISFILKIDSDGNREW